MNLQNGYKVIYDKAIGGEHVFCASKTGAFADAEEILRVAAGEYRLVYEKDGCFYGSTTGIPADDDFVLTSNKIGANRLVYEYKGKLYGTGENLVPTYGEDGAPTDTQLISDEKFAEVFVAKTEETEVEETPVCEHEFVDGVCAKCGEVDPDFVPAE
jgi:hypothetical protein